MQSMRQSKNHYTHDKSDLSGKSSPGMFGSFALTSYNILKISTVGVKLHTDNHYDKSVMHTDELNLVNGKYCNPELLHMHAGCEAF